MPHTTTDRRIIKLNPATGQLIREYPVPTEADVERAYHQAKVAQVDWAKASLKRRAMVLKTVRDKLYQQTETLARIISQETGKPLSDAKEADLVAALSLLSYYAEKGPHQLKPHWVSPDWLSIITGRLHFETWHPRGVIGVISPWNFPMAISCSGVTAALMSGNAVILKPSELTPATGEALIGIIQAALQEHGFSPYTVQLLIGDGTTGAQLMAQPIDGIIFTGSERTGKLIAQQAAERDIWFSLELGGSDAMLILDGCDLEQAASFALWGRYANAGQTCAAVKRLFVPKRHEAEFLKRLSEKILCLNVGGPDTPQNHLGPLINETQRDLIHSQVQDAVTRGAHLLLGGKPLNGEGFFYAPTLLTGVPAEARILQEETFGPVLPVIPYETLESAIEQINASRFGLTASIFGPTRQARTIAPRLESGTVLINEVGASNFAMACVPWGGWKASGSGSSHGASALTDLSRRKIISENLLFRLPFLSKPLWLFGENEKLSPERCKTVLAFAGRQKAMFNPKRWIPFWQNRASSKI